MLSKGHANRTALSEVHRLYEFFRDCMAWDTICTGPGLFFDPREPRPDFANLQRRVIDRPRANIFRAAIAFQCNTEGDSLRVIMAQEDEAEVTEISEISEITDDHAFAKILRSNHDSPFWKSCMCMTTSRTLPNGFSSRTEMIPFLFCE